MSRQEEGALELEATVLEVLDQVAGWSDEDWRRTVQATGWTRAATVMHCATGNDVATAWLAFFVSRRDILDTPEFHTAHNQSTAEHHRATDPATAVSTLKRSTERATRYMRSLTDEEIDRPAHHALGRRQMTAAQFLPTFAKHVRDHMRQATAET